MTDLARYRKDNLLIEEYRAGFGLLLFAIIDRNKMNDYSKNRVSELPVYAKHAAIVKKIILKTHSRKRLRYQKVSFNPENGEMLYSYPPASTIESAKSMLSVQR